MIVEVADQTTTSSPPSLLFYTMGQYLPGNSGLVLAPPATSYNVSDLQPFGKYSFQVACLNEIGMTSSDWISARTLEDGEICLY